MMNLKKFLKILIFFTIFIPAFSSVYPEKLSNKAQFSIINFEYNEYFKSAFSKVGLRIYDKDSGFDELIDFAFFNDFDDPFFPLKFYFFGDKAFIKSQTFSKAISLEKKPLISEILLNLTLEEKNYLYDFLFLMNESFSNRYSYNYDLQTNNSFTHVSAILHDCYTTTNNLTSERLLFTNSKSFTPSYHKVNNKTPVLLYDCVTDEIQFPVANSFQSYNKLPFVCLIIFNIFILFFTIYQTFVSLNITNYRLSVFKFIQSIDFLILFISGFSGLIILFQDLYSSQQMFRNNFEFLFFFPLNIFMAFDIYFRILNIDSKFKRIYWSSITFISVFYFVACFFINQKFPLLSLLFAMPVFFRSSYFLFQEILFIKSSKEYK